MDDGAKSSISKESHPSKNEEEGKTHELFLLWYTVLVSPPSVIPVVRCLALASNCLYLSEDHKGKASCEHKDIKIINGGVRQHRIDDDATQEGHKSPIEGSIELWASVTSHC